MFWNRKKILVTHDGGFHADDVFACAILQIYLDSIGERYTIIRTRDENTIKNADYVFDVGGVYDPLQNRFDHHQKNRAGTRENSIMYAACGLVWRHFGERITGSKKAVEIIDTRIQSLDAADNGQDIYKPIFPGVFPFIVPMVVGDFNLAWNEEDILVSNQFTKAVSFAKEIMKREIVHVMASLESEEDIRKTYEHTSDKRLIVLHKPYSRYEIMNALVGFPEPLYFIYPKSKNEYWKIEALRISLESFDLRKPFPEKWRGLQGEDFQKVSSVPDATFSHDGRFYCTAKTLDGALMLANLAIKG